MDDKESYKVEYIDEISTSSTQGEQYVWKKKKALQKTKAKEFNSTKEDDYNKLTTVKSLKTATTSTGREDDLIFQAKKQYIVSEREKNEILDREVPDIIEDISEISNLESSLSPKAPLVTIDIESTDDSLSFKEKYSAAVSDEIRNISEVTQDNEISTGQNFNLQQSNNDTEEDVLTYFNESDSINDDSNDKSFNIHVSEDEKSNVKNDNIIYDISFKEDVLLCVVIKESTSQQESTVLINDVTDTLHKEQNKEINITLLNKDKKEDLVTSSNSVENLSPVSEIVVCDKFSYKEDLNDGGSSSYSSSLRADLNDINEDLFSLTVKEKTLDRNDNVDVSRENSSENNADKIKTSISIDCIDKISVGDQNECLHLSLSPTSEKLDYTFSSDIQGDKLDNLINKNDEAECKTFGRPDNVIHPYDNVDYFIRVDNLFEYSPCQALTVKALEDYNEYDTSTVKEGVKLQDVSNFIDVNFSFLKDDFSDSGSPNVSSSDEKDGNEKSDRDVGVQTTITLLENIEVVESDSKKNLCHENYSNKNDEEQNISVLENDKIELEFISSEISSDDEKYSNKLLPDSNRSELYFNVSHNLQPHFLITTERPKSILTKDLKNIETKDEPFMRSEMEISITQLLDSCNFSTESKNNGEEVINDEINPSDNNIKNDGNINKKLIIVDNYNKNIKHEDHENLVEMSPCAEQNFMIDQQQSTLENNTNLSDNCIKIQQNDESSCSLSELSEDTEEYYDLDDQLDSQNIAKINDNSSHLRAALDEEIFHGMMEECAWGEFQNRAVEVLSMFRRKLLPGITSATDWIGYCENDNRNDDDDDVDVMERIEEENEDESENDPCDSIFESESSSEFEEIENVSKVTYKTFTNDDIYGEKQELGKEKSEVNEIINSKVCGKKLSDPNLNEVLNVKLKYKQLLNMELSNTDEQDSRKQETLSRELEEGTREDRSTLFEFPTPTDVKNEKTYENEVKIKTTENDPIERKRTIDEDDEVSTEETGVEPSRPWRRRKEYLASDRSLVSTCVAEHAHCGAAEMVLSVELECGLEEGLRTPDSVLHTSATSCSELPSAYAATTLGRNCSKEDVTFVDNKSAVSSDEIVCSKNDKLLCSNSEKIFSESDEYNRLISDTKFISDKSSVENENVIQKDRTKDNNFDVDLEELQNNCYKNNLTFNSKSYSDNDNEIQLVSDSNRNYLLLIQNNVVENEGTIKCSVELKRIENKNKNLVEEVSEDVLSNKHAGQLTELPKEDETGRGLQVGGEESAEPSRDIVGDATLLKHSSGNDPSGVKRIDSTESNVSERDVVNNRTGYSGVKCSEEISNEGIVLRSEDEGKKDLLNDKQEVNCDDKYFNLVDNVFDKKHYGGLFQFNKSDIKESNKNYTNDPLELVASEFEDMRQKKKNDVETTEDGAVDTSGDCCNGYHRGTLKSALKRNTKSSKSSKKKHRVQFDESLNKFFDADYVILIREDPEDGEGICECGEELCYDCTEDEELGLPEEVQSPRFDLCAAFEPPMEFVDQVTLSPPDGYKDISQGCCPHHFHQRRQRSDDREEWEEAILSNRLESNENKNEEEESEPSGSGTLSESIPDKVPSADEQLSPSTPLPSNALHHHQQLQHLPQSIQPPQPESQQQQQRYIVETITMTTVTERRIVREADDQQVQRKTDSGIDGDGKLSGILKGGKLWKSTDSDDSQSKPPEQPWPGPDDPDGRRSVRFCDGQTDTEDLPAPPPTELTLTFKLGNHVMVSNSSRPNSAVRQLFPAPRFMSPPPQPNRSPDSEDPNKTDPKYLVTTENLRLFDESKKSKLKQYFQQGNAKNKDGSSQTLTSPQQENQAFAPASDDEDSLQSNLIKRTIERNTLRRSLLRYPHDSARLKRNQNKMKTENSLVERIKQLTCDVEEEQILSGDEKQTEECSSVMPPRTSPPGEEAKPLPAKSEKVASSGMSSTYKKLTDLFTRRADKPESHSHNSMVLQTPASIEHQYPYYQPVYQQTTSPPDLGNGLNTHLISKSNLVARTNSTTEARKQFLSTLAPLTACVSGSGEDSPVNKEIPGDRGSVASTSTSTAADTEYSLDDIEEALVDEPGKTAPQPDVVAGTPAGDTQDELALFVQQDASRIERLRKRYSSTPSTSTAASEDDEQDDYGFNRRPSVRGIKPRFGSTTEILQQMQSQLQPPPPPGSHVSWPYYAPDMDPRMGRTSGPRGQLPVLKEDSGFTYVQADSPVPEYPSSSPVDGGARYQHLLYSSTGNLHQPMRIGGGGSIHHVHSESPPPGVMVPLQEVPGQMYSRRALPGGSLVQMQVPVPVRLPHYQDDPHYGPATSIIRVGQGQQQTIRVPYPSGTPVQVHLLATRRGDSPQRPPHLVVARGTQTSSISATYYQLPPPPPRSSYPLSIRGPLVYSATHDKPPHLGPYPHTRSSSPTLIPSLTSSPTRMKPHANERGVPEGAASSSPAFPQDSVYSVQVSTSTNIPSPQDIDITNRVQPNNSSSQQPNNPVFYAMNV
ncbi:uncharacterized protein LOC142319869 [Lycorma delicatula]|uniref:uncharacterized protein LOC142319869 n=1 Tax=Lycorma delicatula TaxID=130591 RepID=UPI003F512B73